MLAFVVTLRSGRRFTIRAEELRFSYEGYLELLVSPQPSASEPLPEKQVVGLVVAGEVESVVAKEYLIAEERCETPPHVVRRDDPNDPIPF